MSKIVLLVTIVFISSALSQESWWFGKKNKHDIAKCYDFGKPAKLKGPKLSKNSKHGKDKTKSKNRSDYGSRESRLCLPELTAQFNKNKKNIEKLENDLNKITTVKGLHRTKRSLKKMKKKKDCSVRYSSDFMYKLCKDAKKNKSDKRENKKARITNDYNKEKLKKVAKLLDQKTISIESLEEQYAEYLESYKPEELKKFKNYDLSKPSHIESLLVKIKNDKDFIITHKEMNSPKYIQISNEILALEQDNERLKEPQEHVCDSKRSELNSCPQVQSIFLSRIHPDSTEEEMEDGFRQMVGMIGGFKYGSVSDPDQELYVDVTADNFKEFKKISSSKKHLTQQRQVDFIEDRFTKAQEALANLEYNQKNKDQPGFEPKRVESVCGGCRDLKQMYEKAKSSGNQVAQNKLYQFDKTLGCGIVKESTKSCDEQVSKVLKANQFNPQTGDKRVSIESAFSDLKRVPSNYSNKMDNAFEELLSLAYENENKEVETCISCKVIKDKLSTLGTFEKQKTRGDDGLESTSSYFKLKNKNDQKYFESLQAIALKNSCIKADDYKLSPTNSCQSHISYFKNFILENPNMDSISSQKRSEHSSKLEQLRSFESKQGISCCDEIIDNIESKTDIYNKAFIKNDPKVSLAESMECLKCGQSKKSNEKIDTEELNTSVSSCDFYKNYIQKASKDSLRGFKVNGESYSISSFLETEVYTCKDGPKKSVVDPSRDWETIAYSEYGKYGAHSELNLQCYIDPTNGQAVNLTCCNMKDNSASFKKLKRVLSSSSQSSLDLTSSNKNFSASKKLEDLNSNFSDSKSLNFCKDIFGKYKASKEAADTSKWKVCVDNRGSEFYRLDSFQKIPQTIIESTTSSRVDKAN